MKKNKLSVYLVLIFFITSCSWNNELFKYSEAKNSEDVGNVFVSAYPAIPWSDISSQLSPQFNYTTEQAQKLALQTTQSQFSQALSTLALGLGLTLPVKSEITTESDKGKTFSKVENEGTPPNSSNVGNTSVSAINLNSNQNANLGVASDTLLTNTEAILYRTKIADNRISKQYIAKGYTAQLITFQVNLQPRKRNLPYDTYVDISLFPDPLITKYEKTKTNQDDNSTSDNDERNIVVHPLLISDAMEATSVNRTLQSLRQALLQLSGTSGVIGANAGVGGGKSESEQILGFDKNSLLTAGIVKDSMVRVRIGAENSGAAGMAIVPKSINLSLMVLVKENVKQLKVLANEQFVDANSGTALSNDSMRRIKLAKGVASYIDQYDLKVNCHKNLNECIDISDNKEKPDIKLFELSLSEFEKICKVNCINIYLDFLRDSNLGKYEKIKSKLIFKNGKSFESEQPDIIRMLAKLNQLNVSQAYSTMHIPLKVSKNAILPPEQTGVLTDDNKVLTAVFRNGKDLEPLKLNAKLKLNVNSKDLTLFPNSISTGNNNSDVSVTFPSLKQISADPASAKIDLCIKSKDSEECDNQLSRTYTSWYIYGKDEKEKIANPIKTSATQLVPDKNHSSIITVSVDELKSIDGFTLPYKLSVDGADIRSPSGSIDLKSGASITLTLGNLSPIKPISFIAVDKNKKPIGSPLIVPVIEGYNK